jgi:hypothetical protein
MNKKKIVNILLWAAVAISIILSALTFVFGLNSEGAYAKIVLLIVSVLFIALACMVGYLAYMDTFKITPSKEGSKKKPLNYFLNANGKKKGIPLEELTFEIVDKQMNKYVIDAFGSPVALWKNSVFSAGEEAFGKDGAFKVLLAYKMLSDLQMHHSKKAWKMFFELPDVDFADIKECLVRNGDDELAKNLNTYRLAGEGCVREAAAYLDENASYIQKRMLNYVTRKINSFDM